MGHAMVCFGVLPALTLTGRRKEPRGAPRGLGVLDIQIWLATRVDHKTGKSDGARWCNAFWNSTIKLIFVNAENISLRRMRT